MSRVQLDLTTEEARTVAHTLRAQAETLRPSVQRYKRMTNEQARATAKELSEHLATLLDLAMRISQAINRLE